MVGAPFRASVFLVAGLLLAGCFGGKATPDSTGPTASASSSPMATAPVSAAPTPTVTDTLHLLDESRLTTVAVRSSQPLRIPISSFSAVADGFTGKQQSYSQWNFTWPEQSSTVSGVITVVVDVEGVVTNPLAAASSNGTACFWGISVDIFNPQQNVPQQGDGGGFTWCGLERFAVTGGIRTLTVPFLLPESVYKTGYAVSLNIVAAGAVLAPGASLDVLTGSAQADSTIAFDGVGWPIDLGQVTLLTTS